jgi:hypothetical protein
VADQLVLVPEAVLQGTERRADAVGDPPVVAPASPFAAITSTAASMMVRLRSSAAWNMAPASETDRQIAKWVKAGRSHTR